MEAVVHCVDLAATADFLVALGLRLDTISPADDPSDVVLQAGTGAVRVRRSGTSTATTLVLRSDALGAGLHQGPEGLTVEVHPVTPRVAIPDAQPSLTIVGAADGGAALGRAGMAYRDLLPDRWGGRFIASHITIADGGDVPDYVHFHRVRFQMIFVAAGWVDVVYEDQGPPCRMSAGDCVLQPPEIRHRVLRSSPGLEVIEVGCPAVHDTVAEAVIELPTGNVDRDRDFGGQRFVRHVATETATVPSVIGGFDERDTGIGAGTRGLAGARVLSVDEPHSTVMLTHGGEFVMNVVLTGSADLRVDGEPPVALSARSAVTIPSGRRWGWAEPSRDFTYLEVALPDGAVELASA